MTTKTHTCSTPTAAPTPVLSDNKPTRLVRRVIQKFAPIRDARVRYDREHNLWALLDEEDQPIRHFTHGFMEDVKFTTKTVRQGFGCGASSTEIGIAQGTLRESVYHPEVTSLQNLHFSHGFCDPNGRQLHTASVLQLMPERRAVYRP